MVWWVAAVGEPAGDIGLGDGGKGGPGGGPEVVVGAGLGTAEAVFDLGEGFLDWVEVGRVGRQRQEVGTTRLDGGADSRAVMGAEVVGDDDLARAESRGEAEPDVPQEAGGRHRPIEPQRRPDTVKGQRRNHGLVLAAIDRCGRVGALATRRPGVRRRVPEVAAGLIQEYQVL